MKPVSTVITADTYRADIHHPAVLVPQSAPFNPQDSQDVDDLGRGLDAWVQEAAAGQARLKRGAVAARVFGDMMKNQREIVLAETDEVPDVPQRFQVTVCRAKDSAAAISEQIEAMETKFGTATSPELGWEFRDALSEVAERISAAALPSERKFDLFLEQMRCWSKCCKGKPEDGFKAVNPSWQGREYLGDVVQRLSRQDANRIMMISSLIDGKH